MDWWTLFRKIRKVIFAFIALFSLTWAVFLSLYLSREWNHFSILQRGLVLALIGVNGVTSLLLYLMIVVVFKMWKELFRMLFLLVIHIGSAIPFTIFGLGFSCEIFDTESTCRAVNVGFIATAWAVTGLLLGYTVYLCIMSRVPRPFPLIIPNDLLGTTVSLSRTPSNSSDKPKTGVVAKAETVLSGGPASRLSSGSVYSQNSVTSGRTVPKKVFIANYGSAAQAQQAAYRNSATREQPFRIPSYSSTVPRVSLTGPEVLKSRFSATTTASVDIDPPPQARFSWLASMSGMLSRQVSARVATSPRTLTHIGLPGSPRPLLLTPKPFSAPLSRHGSPEAPSSSSSFIAAPANLHLGHVATYNPSTQPQAYGSTITPFTAYPQTPPGIPPQLQPGGARDHSGRPSYPYFLGTLSGSSSTIDLNSYFGASSSSSLSRTSSNTSTSTSGHSMLGTPQHMHSPSSSGVSIHSLVPSVHHTDEYGFPAGVSRGSGGPSNMNVNVYQAPHGSRGAFPLPSPFPHFHSHPSRWT